MKGQPGGRMSEDVARAAFSQIVSGVCYIHRRSIVHRDLKPDNVLTSGDCFKLADFGLSEQGGGMRDAAGTPLYAAPEVLFPEKFPKLTNPSAVLRRKRTRRDEAAVARTASADDTGAVRAEGSEAVWLEPASVDADASSVPALVADVDARTPTSPTMRPLRDEYTIALSDIWSLGCVLHEMVFGVLPYNVKSVAELKAAIFDAPLELPPPDVDVEGDATRPSADLIDLLRRLLERDPLSRPSIDAVASHPWLSCSTSIARLGRRGSDGGTSSGGVESGSASPASATESSLSVGGQSPVFGAASELLVSTTLTLGPTALDAVGDKASSGDGTPLSAAPFTGPTTPAMPSVTTGSLPALFSLLAAATFDGSKDAATATIATAPHAAAPSLNPFSPTLPRAPLRRFMNVDQADNADPSVRRNTLADEGIAGVGSEAFSIDSGGGGPVAGSAVLGIRAQRRLSCANNSRGALDTAVAVGDDVSVGEHSRRDSPAANDASRSLTPAVFELPDWVPPYLNTASQSVPGSASQSVPGAAQSPAWVSSGSAGGGRAEGMASPTERGASTRGVTPNRVYATTSPSTTARVPGATAPSHAPATPVPQGMGAPPPASVPRARSSVSSLPEGGDLERLSRMRLSSVGEAQSMMATRTKDVGSLEQQLSPEVLSPSAGGIIGFAVSRSPASPYTSYATARPRGNSTVGVSSSIRSPLLSPGSALGSPAGSLGGHTSAHTIGAVVMLDALAPSALSLSQPQNHGMMGELSALELNGGADKDMTSPISRSRRAPPHSE